MYLEIIDKIVSVTRKYSPEIMMGLGIAGVISGTILACKETTEVTPIISDHIDQIDVINIANEHHEIVDIQTNAVVEYTDTDYRRDIAMTYLRTSGRLIRHYAPSVLLIGGSIGLFIGSHNIMSKRNLGLTAAYASISEAFNRYRQNIIEKYGESADTEARFNVKAKKVKGKDGEPDTIEYQRTDNTSATDHSQFFDAESVQWDKSVNMNLMVLNSTITNLNRLLKTRRSHIVTLNEFAGALDLHEYKDGQVLGWKWRPGIDPLDVNGLPMIVAANLINVADSGVKQKKDLKTIGYDEVIEPVMLIDPQNLEVII